MGPSHRSGMVQSPVWLANRTSSARLATYSCRKVNVDFSANWVRENAGRVSRLQRKALQGELQNQTEVLYISPLKALGNDIQKNLEVPLGEILQLAGQRGFLMPEIRAAVRTGDTLIPERRAMLMRAPHILVTTPESLYILLTAQKSREILKTVETVVVDEIHAVADDKRGAHLSLSLERLEALTGRPPV